MLVQEILSLAPELKEKENDVRRLVELLLESKPDITIDEQFVMELRTQLRNKVQTGVLEEINQESLVSRMSGLFNSKFAYAFAVMILTVLVVSPFMLRNGQISNSSVQLAFDTTIKDVKAGAFGDLSSHDDGVRTANSDVAMEKSFTQKFAMEEAASSEYYANEAAGMGGAPSVAPTMPTIAMDVAIDTDDGERMEADVTESMIAPMWKAQYPKYIFRGDFPNMTDIGAVYRKVDSSLSSSGLAQLVNKLDLGVIDLGTFSGAQVRNLEVVSTGDPAYTISINFNRGTISLYKNWTGEDDVVYTSERSYNPAAIDKENVIRVADSFLKKHNIDISSYGEPEIDMLEYETYIGEVYESGVAVESLSYAPVYNVQVRYPLVLGGKKVVESSGYAVGMNVSVNVSGQYVEGVWGLETLAFERSEYPLITDESTILSMIEQGGYSSGYWREENGTEVEVDVYEPEVVLMKHWKYDSDYRTEKELFVPALLFQVDSKAAREKNMYVQNKFVVPLVEGVWQESNRLVPMQLLESASAGGVSDGGVVEAEMVVVDEE